MIEFIQYAKRIGLPIVILLLFFLINPFEKGYLAAYPLVIIIYSKNNFLVKNLDFDFLILFLFSSVYALFYSFRPEVLIQTFLFLFLFPPAFYLLGKYVVTKSQNVNELYTLFFIVGASFSLTALLSVGSNLLAGGYGQFERTIPNFWTATPMTATLMAAYFTFNICIPALIIVRKQNLNFLYKIIGLGLFVASLLCVFRLGSRTQIVILAATIAISLLYIVPNQGPKRNLRLFISIFIVAALIVSYIPLNLDADYLSVFGDRLKAASAANNATAGHRTQIWAESIEYLFTKPFGWQLVGGANFSHNLWLDVARVCGILPFFFLSIFTVRNIIYTKRAVLGGKNDIAFRSMILIYTFAANLQFFVEPIMQGIFFMFVVYCFYQGAIKKYAENKTTAMNNQTNIFSELKEPEQSSSPRI